MQILNIEIKLRLEQPAEARARVAALADGPARVLEQRDTYFSTGTESYLKLREENGRAALIAYRRTLGDAPAPSDIRLLEIDNGQTLADTLGHVLPVVQVVEKTRKLYFCGQTRIHLDQVRGLGEFLELEVVLEPDQQEADGERIAAALLDQLGLAAARREHRSYRDLVGGWASVSR